MTWAWAVTLAIFAALIAVDLLVTRKPGRDGLRAAAVLSVAVLLAFIGVTMLVSPFVHLPVALSVAVIVVVIGTAVTASRWHDCIRPPRIHQPNEPVRE